MTKFYAESTKGFYDDTLHHIMPPDVLPINNSDYDQIMMQQNSSQGIGIDSNGCVALIPIKRTAEEESNFLISCARTALSVSDLTILRCIENEISVPMAWVEYRKTLREIVSNRSELTTLPTAPPYPQI